MRSMWFLIAVLYGCTSEPLSDASITDAGTDAGVIASVTPPALPQPASLPTMTPCPAGWLTVDDQEEAAFCLPWPEDDPCPSHEIRFPGGPCQEIGSVCPQDDFATDLPATNVIYVLRWAQGGDGSYWRPYGTITEALSQATAGMVVAIGKGNYQEAITLPDGVTLWGACARQTVITSSAAAVVTIAGADTHLRQVTLQDSPGAGVLAEGVGRSLTIDGVALSNVSTGLVVRDRAHLSATNLLVDAQVGPGMLLEAGAEASLVRTHVERARASGVRAVGDGTRLIMEDSVVHATEPATDHSAGVGIDLRRGAQATIRRSVVSENHSAGIAATSPGTTVELEHAVIRDTQCSELDGAGGHGILVSDDASVLVIDSLLERNRDAAVQVVSAEAQLKDCIARDTRATERIRDDSTHGYGLFAESSNLTMRRVLLARNRVAGLNATEATLKISDLVVQDTASDFNGLNGLGLWLQDDVQVDAEKVVVERNRRAGVQVECRSDAQLRDLVVRDTFPNEADGFYGMGLSLQCMIISFEGGVLTVDVGPATVSLARGLFERNHSVGIDTFARGDLHLEDIVVKDTEIRTSGSGGIGVAVYFDSQLEMVRAEVDNNHMVGIHIEGETTAVLLQDTVVSNTEPDGNADFGRGLAVLDGATATVTRALILDSVEVGIETSTDSTVILEDVVISGVAGRHCSGDTCPDSYGMGIGAYVRSTVSVDRFMVQKADLCGVQLATESSMDLHNGEVSRNAIGACVQVEGYDIERLTDEVYFLDNEINLQSVTLPVPKSLPRLEDEL